MVDVADGNTRDIVVKILLRSMIAVSFHFVRMFHLTMIALLILQILSRSRSILKFPCMLVTMCCCSAADVTPVSDRWCLGGDSHVRHPDPQGPLWPLGRPQRGEFTTQIPKGRYGHSAVLRGVSSPPRSPRAATATRPSSEG